MTTSRLTDADVPVSAHLTYGPAPDWTTEINYSVSYRFCEPGDPMYGQRETVAIKAVGEAGWKAAQEMAARLARPYMLRATPDAPMKPLVIQDEIEIYAMTVLRSPQKKLFVMNGVDQ